MDKTLIGQKVMATMRLQGMGLVFQRADRIISGNPRVEVNIENSGKKVDVAWSQGHQIFLNENRIGPIVTNDDMIKIIGLNHHELCHVMFTPSSHLITQHITYGNFGIFNMLEDMRIEMIMVRLYPATAAYFVKSFTDFCLENEKQWDSAHLLAYGRKFLPSSIRDALRTRMVENPSSTLSVDALAEYEELVEEYNGLVMPKNLKRAAEIVNRVASLLYQTPLPDTSHISIAVQGSCTDETKQEEAQGRPAVAEYQPPSGSDDDGDSDGSGDDDGEGYGNGDGDGDGDGDALSDDGDGDAFSDDEGDDGDGDGNGDGGNSDADDGNGRKDGKAEGKGDQKQDGDGDSDLYDDLRDISTSIKLDRDVRRDIEQMRQASDQEMKNASPLSKRIAGTSRDVDLQLSTLQRRFQRELQRLWVDSDPGWERDQRRGRLNVGRVMRGASFDTAFDQWQEGNSDAASLEVVVAVDTSGSMAMMMNESMQAVWTIKRSVESVGGRVTVIGYASDTSILIPPDEPAKPSQWESFTAIGLTYAATAMDAARAILGFSDAKHRIMFITTDGEWDDAILADQRIQMMNQSGVMTGCIYLASDAHTPKYHGCKYRRAGTPDEIVEMAREMVHDAMSERG